MKSVFFYYLGDNPLAIFRASFLKHFENFGKELRIARNKADNNIETMLLETTFERNADFRLWKPGAGEGGGEGLIVAPLVRPPDKLVFSVPSQMPACQFSHSRETSVRFEALFECTSNWIELFDPDDVSPDKLEERIDKFWKRGHRLALEFISRFRP